MDDELIGRVAMVLTARALPSGERDSDTGHYYSVGDVVEIVRVYPYGAGGPDQRVDVDGPWRPVDCMVNDGSNPLRQVIPLGELQYLD